MPLFCTIRPNRSGPRRFKPRDVGRIYCYALRDGATRAELAAEIAKCEEPEERPDREVEEALAAAEQALLQNNALLDSDISILQRMLQLLGILAALGRFIVRIPIPAAKVVGGSALVLKELAESRLKQIAVQKSANDAAIAIIRRAAANDARFRRVSGG